MEKSMIFRPENYNPSVLAYMGDAFLELLTREYLIGDGDCKTNVLNQQAKDFVTAKSQSAAVERVLPILTEREIEIYKAGRNTKSGQSSKSAGKVEYRRATGFECLFGYLYLSGEHERANEIFCEAFCIGKEESL